MWKKIALIAILLFTATLAFGGYVEIGTGTSNTGYVPTYGYWDYSWSQVIYLQSEIGSPFDITKISYDVSNTPSNYTFYNQKIYMKHTTLTQFPDAFYDDPIAAGFTLVYEGDVTFDGSGWHVIPLDNPFSYNGTDNLIVYWQNWDGDYASGYPKFYYTNQTDRAKYKYADNTFPDVSGTLKYYAANIRLHYFSLYDVQYTEDPGPDGTYPSPYLGQTVTISGIVTGVRYNGFWLEEQPGGPWCGVWVFNYTIDPSVGDSLTLTGEVTEYYGMTEIQNVSDYTIHSSGHAIPFPAWVETGELSSTKDAASAEPYEGCLVRVSGVTVTQTVDGHGQWYVDDGTGECQIDDAMYGYEPDMGEEFSHIVGCLDYSYDEYGINPRDAGDLKKGLYEGFESGVIPDDWTVINADGDSYEWYAYHSASNAHFGEWSAKIHYNFSGNDDWLITPQLQVPTDKSAFDNDVFSFWAKSSHSSQFEDFEVWLSTTGTAVGDFTEFLGSVTGVPNTYTEYTYPLDDYAGEKVYIAVRCVSVNRWYLYVDDVEAPGLVPFQDYDAAVDGLPNAGDPDTLDAGVFDAYVTVYNNSIPLTGPTVSFVVYYKIWDDEGNLVGSKSANVWDMEPQERRTIYFDGGICVPPGTYLAVVTIQTAFDDPNTDNNTSMRVFTVVGGAKMGAEELPQVFALRGCEPNPTRGDAVIRYDLPRGVDVSLKVYDSAGRLVESLVDGMRDAGYHRVNWRAPHAGVYFAKLAAGDFKATKRIIAVK